MGLQFKRDTDYFGSKKAASSDWIGIILPFASQEQQQRGYGGYGYRRRVAIMGHTPSDRAKLADDKVIFAVVGLPTNAGSGAGNRKSKVKLSQGDVVFGRFIDQNTEQVPIILGVLGRTKEIVYGEGRFDIKPGLVGNTQALNLLGTEETNEDSGDCSPGATTSPKTEAKNATQQLEAGGLKSEPTVGAVPQPKINPLDTVVPETLSKMTTEELKILEENIKIEKVPPKLQKELDRLGKILEQEEIGIPSDLSNIGNK